MKRTVRNAGAAVKRIVILDRGVVGKSTLGQQLRGILGTLRDRIGHHLLEPGPRPTPEPEWAQIQNRLVTPDRWTIDTPRALHRWTM
jgi:hypothetical protein